MSVTINASTSSGLVQTADTSGTVEIQSNGSTKLTVSSTGAYGQLVSATAQTASSTAVDFTGIPSWVKRITVMFSGVSTNGTSNLQLQIGSGSFTTSGYVSRIASITSNTSYSGTNTTSGYGLATPVTAAGNYSGNITITNITGNTWVESHTLADTAGTTSYFGGGSIALSGTLDRIRITTVNGTDTFDAGTINLLYEG